MMNRYNSSDFVYCGTGVVKNLTCESREDI